MDREEIRKTVELLRKIDVEEYGLEFHEVVAAGAVKAYLGAKADGIKMLQFSDFNKKNIGVLRAYAKTGKVDAQFIEMMACEGGCVTGPSAHNDPMSGRRQLNQDLLKRTLKYENIREE